MAMLLYGRSQASRRAAWGSAQDRAAWGQPFMAARPGSHGFAVRFSLPPHAGSRFL